MYYSSAIYNSLQLRNMLSQYSPLEELVRYSISHQQQNRSFYSPKLPSYSFIFSEYKFVKKEYEPKEIPFNFLNPIRPRAKFVGKAAEVQPFIRQTFNLLTKQILPQDIIINIVPEEILKQEHKKLSNSSGNILGFAINKRIPEIFVLENSLDILMMTLGHEIGHVLTGSLRQLTEEAKAFAFEMAWIKTIIDNNIAGLQSSFNLNPKPAKNGLHDLAFNFVLSEMKKGKSAFRVYEEIISNNIYLKE